MNIKHIYTQRTYIHFYKNAKNKKNSLHMTIHTFFFAYDHSYIFFAYALHINIHTYEHTYIHINITYIHKKF